MPDRVLPSVYHGDWFTAASAKLDIVCCKDMPTGLGNRIGHLLTIHRDEIPLELVVAVDAMLDQVAAAIRDISAALEVQKDADG